MRRCRHSLRRPLRFEALEDRRLLSITVDTFFDEADGSVMDGDISLRDALALSASGETIDFDSSLAGETILLTLGELAVENSVDIDASTLSGSLTIDASGNDPTPNEGDGDGSRVLNIDDGDNATNIHVTIRGLTLTGGDVSGDGGAIHNQEDLTILKSTITGNWADRAGGIANSGILRFDNSTMSGNIGGGIFNSFASELEMTSATITENQAESAAGVDNLGTARLINTIVAGNIGTVENTDVSGDFISAGHNLIGNIGSGANVSGFVVDDFVGTGNTPIDPRLTPLADHGGTTLTHALLPGSVAIDAGETGDLGNTIVADLSGNHNNGASIGEITLGAGQLGEAANFPAGGNGVPENYISLDVENLASSQIPTEAITLAAWVRITQTGLRHPIFSSRNSNDQLVVHADIRADGKITFILQDDNGDTVFEFTGGIVPFNSWFHFAVTFKQVNNQLILYINGNVVAGVEGPANSNLSIGSDWDTGAKIGSMTFNPNDPFRGQFTGLMDEFYMFTRSLSGFEIMALATLSGAQTGIPQVTGDLSLYYPFDDFDAATDQRGSLRVVDGDGLNGATIDIGAFERINDFNPDNPIPEEIQSGSIAVHISPIATGLVSPSLVVNAEDNSGRIFVSDQIGIIHLVNNGVLQATPFLDITDLVRDSLSGNDERGLSGFAFHPDFASTGMAGYGVFYTWADELVDDLATVDFTHFPLAPGVERSAQTVLREWSTSDIDSNTFSGTSRELLRIDQPHLAHSAGNVEFGPDGYLYLSLGDGGTHDDQGPGHNPDTGNARDLTNVYGSILRIDPFGTNSANGKYGIPASNPFVGDPLALDEIFFYGLRNPFRFSFERDADGNKTTKIVIGDTGQDDIEEVDRADIVLDAGGHFGWNLKEGTFLFDAGPPPGPGGELRIGVTANSPGSPLGLIDPIVQYDHGSNGEGSAVIGGFTYQGDLIPELKGMYVFGDFNDFTSPFSPNGRVFYTDLSDPDPEIFELNLEGTQLSGGGGLSIFIKGFGVDETGEIYVVGSTTLQSADNSGVILKLTPTSPSVTVTPTAGLETTEDGGTAEIDIVLTSQPTDSVTLALASDNTDEGTVSIGSVTFTSVNWHVVQTVTITGVSDEDIDGPVQYVIVIGPAISADSEYAGLDPEDLLVTNIDTTAPGLTADFDTDDDIDGFDFLLWQRGFGSGPGASKSDGDANFDGMVEGLDLTQWQATYGNTAEIALVASLDSLTHSTHLSLPTDLYLRLLRGLTGDTILASSRQGNSRADGVISNAHRVSSQALLFGLPQQYLPAWQEFGPATTQKYKFDKALRAKSAHQDAFDRLHADLVSRQLGYARPTSLDWIATSRRLAKEQSIMDAAESIGSSLVEDIVFDRLGQGGF
jgi:glucose/arabinose dehydrogenase